MKNIFLFESRYEKSEKSIKHKDRAIRSFSRKTKNLLVTATSLVGLLVTVLSMYGCTGYSNPHFEPALALPWESHSIKFEKMPQVVGLPKESATSLMNESVADYYYTYDFDDTVPTGCVIRTSIDAGKNLSNSDVVELVISLGPSSFALATPDTSSVSAVATPMPATGYHNEGMFELMSLNLMDNEGIAIYRNEILGITPNTTVSYTGYPYVFDDWTKIAALSTSSDSIIGLRGDGTVIAYGSNEYDQCNVSAWTNVEQVAAGGTFTLGLTASRDKILFAGKSSVGYNADIQNAVKSWNHMNHISAGMHHAVGKTLESNTVVAAGDNSYGQCNVSHWTDIQVVVAGDNHTVGLRNDGTVVATGLNDQGQCNVENWTNIVSIAAAGNHTIGLRSDGTVLSTKGCEIGTHSQNICGIAAGDEFYIAVLGDNSVISSSPEYRYALMAWTVEYSCEERWFNAKYGND